MSMNRARIAILAAQVVGTILIAAARGDLRFDEIWSIVLVRGHLRVAVVSLQARYSGAFGITIQRMMYTMMPGKAADRTEIRM
jgi:hypothetical protein